MNYESTALLVIDSADPHQSGNEAIRTRLESLGYTVTVKDMSVASTADAVQKDVVVISTIIGSPDIHVDFLRLEVPVVVADGAMFELMRMSLKAATPETCSFVSHHRHRRIYLGDPSHSLSAALKGRVEVCSQAMVLGYGRPAPGALTIATLPEVADILSPLSEDAGKAVIFAYERGAELCQVGADASTNVAELRAPARRVGIFVGSGVADYLTASGWALFDAAINWAVGEELKQFAEVFREEWQEIYERRQRQRFVCTRLPNEPDLQRPPANLAGLALSGGGIRSATFCLGLLQGLEKSGVLRAFDYVSTVSGGGYLGGWWSAWLSRNALHIEDRCVYPLLSVNDLRSPVKLAARLRRDTDPATEQLSELLYSKFPKETKELFDETIDQGGRTEEVTKALVNELNNVLREPTFYTRSVFENREPRCAIELSQETRYLL